MEKLATGGFSSKKGLFIETDGELYGSFGNEKLLPYQSFLILEEAQKAVEKQKGNIKVNIGGKENP